MKLDKGQSKNRHVIRPRNLDHNKKLLVTTERDDSLSEMQIPRVPNIEVPKIEILNEQKPFLSKFSKRGYYIGYLSLPNYSLENIIGYEITEEDKQALQAFEAARKIPQGFVTDQNFEDSIEVWEIDTGKGQIIPCERARYLIKEQKICEKWEIAENSNTTNSVVQVLYEYWIKRREKLGRPLLRRFWKSEGITDSQLKIAFQPRSSYRDKYRLRNSKKNDYEAYDKMRGLARQMESLQTILKAINIREMLKQSIIENKIAAFEQERAEKHQKKVEAIIVESKIIDQSKDLRNSIKVSDFTHHSVPIPPPVVSQQLKLPTDLPIKRLRPDIPKKSDISFDIALICCRLISEGERNKLWPLINPRRGEISESNHIPNHIVPLPNEEKLKMRGRIVRGTKKIAIDRQIMNEYEHIWGRYLGLNGNWHSLENEIHSEYYDDEDNEAFQRLHKLVTFGFRNFSKVRTH